MNLNLIDHITFPHGDPMEDMYIKETIFLEIERYSFEDFMCPALHRSLPLSFSVHPVILLVM